MLKAARNQYQGVFVGEQHLPDSADSFALQLAASMPGWAGEGIKVVWLQVPAERSDLIPVAVAEGFEFHHCHASRLMLVKRLVHGAYVPSGATHTIGVGGVVLSRDRRLLVVLERRDVTARPGYYKLPGGMLEKGEHFAAGVEREVLEETGVSASFRGLISLRHHHQGQFGTSNIYAVCLLSPDSFEIVVDDEEIGDAMWVPVDHYLANPDIGVYNRRVVAAALAFEPLASVQIDGYMKAGDYEVFIGEDAARGLAEPSLEKS